ncbi:2-keto-4-pentenoate hydratase/2-oxohepta-3-ene-1,7-dioic acid hydratase in catechol pathway [Nocardiopsis arvandica]|uniref:2-keto-4-pentenoate hydratase/2-oxohepta-3-ene-1,7-dioic acid hydratase in catechol pathway n=1 Tax=Nocardiopsis sinuspersici TaxID=501010 RepID=A0A7Y9X9X4_9ACTN|nr:fumarylacetoacetate hydrolase family protein [Nocardiopsis sinuspersici]NYH51072.1 2-keto-4-pentenoate hydratase/2-oxohepta-3-ene-1,7-dioic acid hydratase in catechol pathway [Nocardiopsis sinuspersici]
MRLATYQHEGLRRCGVVEGEEVLPLPEGTDLLDLVGGAPVPETGTPVPLAGVRLLPPLEPPSVRDFVTFEEHVEGVRRSVSGEEGVPDAWYDAPTFYFANPAALVGAHDDVPVPPGCEALDFELEVAAVVGRPGGDLTPERAREHIFGYTVFNDWSARDIQSREMRVGLGPCKGKDAAATLGPWLVTADELEPHRDGEGFLRLALTAEVNGEVVGSDLLSNMGWTFEEMLAHASRGTTVRTGDVLGSGTCGNGGCLAELWGRRGRQDPPPLRPGDTVTLTVEGVGTVANTVVPGKAVEPVPGARRRPRDRP